MSAMVADAEGGPAAVGGMHEGIIPTSSPFYNGNPSSRIWGRQFFRVPDSGSQFPVVDNGMQSPSSSSSYVTAPSLWEEEVAKGEFKGAVPWTASPASSSSSAFPSTSSLFVSASSGISSASSGFSSATSAFSSPASFSSVSSHAVGSGTPGSSGLSAGKPRRHSGRRDSGFVARAPVGTGMGASSAKQKEIGPEVWAYGGSDPLQNIGGRLRSGGGLNTGERAGNSGFKAVMKDSSEGHFGDSGFRFNSGNWKLPVETIRSGSGGITFRFGSENAMPSAEGPALTGFRFGSKVAKAAEELPTPRVSTASPLSFTSENLNNGSDSAFISGFSRLNLSADEMSPTARASPARPNAGGFVFGAGNLNVTAAPVRKLDTDLPASRSPRPGIRRDEAFLAADGETSRSSFKFNHGSGFPAERYAVATESSTAAVHSVKEALTEDTGSSFFRSEVELDKPAADAFQPVAGDFGSNSRTKPDAAPASNAFPESLNEVSIENTAVDEKYAECYGETDPESGEGGSRIAQEREPVVKVRVLSAPSREGSGIGELSPRQGPFVFGAEATFREDQSTGSSLFPRSRPKPRKGFVNVKGKGLAARTSKIFADGTSSMPSTTHEDSPSAGQDAGGETIQNFEQAAAGMHGTGHTENTHQNDRRKPVFGASPPGSGSTLNGSPHSSESDLEVDGSAFADRGTAIWNADYVGMLNGFKRSLGIYDDCEITHKQNLQPPPKSAVNEAPSSEFQVSGGLSGVASPEVSGTNAGLFVFGSTKAQEAAGQRRESPGKRKKGKVHGLQNNRKPGKASVFKQDRPDNTEERSPSPMDFSPRDEEDMEEDDGVKSLRMATGSLSIGKDSISEEASRNHQHSPAKTGSNSAGYVGLSKIGKRAVADTSFASEDSVPLQSSTESSGSSSKWTGFVFSAGSSQTSAGVQRRHIRKAYREKGPENRKPVKVKGQTGSSDGIADRDHSIAEEFSVRLCLIGRPASGPKVPENESFSGSSSGGFGTHIKTSPNVSGTLWSETMAEAMSTSGPPPAVVVAAEQACETWRLRYCVLQNVPMHFDISCSRCPVSFLLCQQYLALVYVKFSTTC